MELEKTKSASVITVNSQSNNIQNKRGIKMLIFEIGSKIMQEIFGRKPVSKEIEDDGEIHWDNGIENVMYDDSEVWFEPLPVRF